MAKDPIVIIHASQYVASSLSRCLEQAGYPVLSYPDYCEWQNDQQADRYALIIADEDAPYQNGKNFFEALKSKTFQLPVILVSANASIQGAVKAIKMGASDYLTTPIDDHLFLASVSKSLSSPSPYPGKNSKSEDDRQLITCSENMQELISMAQRIANSSATVLIQGESGTGKELLARHIHINGERKDKPFVAMNCAALPEHLAESELFGYEKGAFTGAAKTRAGRFEQANNGTLLLDEVSEMPLAMQAKLLRVLQEKEIDPLGGAKPIRVNVRCIATSNQDLAKMVSEGRFRQDLYFRLRVIPLTIPPLRERKGDIPYLLEHFLRKYHPEKGRALPQFNAAALNALEQWHWPGNVRELENTVERAVLISNSQTIGNEALFLEQNFDTKPTGTQDGLIGMTVKEIERKLIGQTLSHLNHNRTHAAKMLGISIRTLRNKLREYHENENVVTTGTEGK